MKTIIAAIIIFVIFVNAMPVSEPIVTATNVDEADTEVFALAKPALARLSTYSPEFTLAGFGENGVTIRVLSHSKGEYVPLKDKSGGDIVYAIGASGLFIQPIELSYGDNNLALQIEKEGRIVGTTTLTLNLVSPNIVDIIQGTKPNLKDIR